MAKNPSVKIGDTIRIISLTDEPFNSNYIGRTGVVDGFDEDCYGEPRIHGTWGGIFIYPNEDSFELVK